MAIAKTVTYKGLVVNNGYHRVVNLVLHKISMSFDVVLSATGGGEELSRCAYVAPYDLSGHNPYIQAYTYLKAMPEYCMSVDC